MPDFVNTIDLLGDEAVTKALIDRTITEFNDDVLTSVGKYAFYRCINLTSVDFPNVTSVGDYAFRYCTALTNVNLPSCSSHNNQSYIFGNCTSLKYVKLPLLTSWGQNMFYDCTALETGDFPKVTVSGINAFSGCKALKIVILRSETMCSLQNTGVFRMTPFAEGGTGGRAIVPRSLIESYQTATNWSTLYAAGTCTFLALEDYTIDGTITGEIDWDKLGGTT